MRHVARAAPWAIAAVALFLTLRGLLAQAAIQANLAGAMQGVRENVREAGSLTLQTAGALAPLGATADTLKSINDRLRATGGDLAEMNSSLERVIATQRSMLARLGGLNQHTAGVVRALGQIDGQNHALLEATTALKRQTAGQADTLETLSELTEESIGYLQSINRKFAFLRRL